MIRPYPENTPRERYTDEELDAMQRALAEVRYGIPYIRSNQRDIRITFTS